MEQGVIVESERQVPAGPGGKGGVEGEALPLCGCCHWWSLTADMTAGPGWTSGKVRTQRQTDSAINED